MDFETISAASWRAKKYSFAYLVATNRTKVGSFLSKRTAQIQHLFCFHQFLVIPFLLWLLGRRFVVSSTFQCRTMLEDNLLYSLAALYIISYARSMNHSFGSYYMSSITEHYWCKFMAQTRIILNMDVFTRFHQSFVLRFRSISRSCRRCLLCLPMAL